MELSRKDPHGAIQSLGRRYHGAGRRGIDDTTQSLHYGVLWHTDWRVFAGGMALSLYYYLLSHWPEAGAQKSLMPATRPKPRPAGPSGGVGTLAMGRPFTKAALESAMHTYHLVEHRTSTRL